MTSPNRQFALLLNQCTVAVTNAVNRAPVANNDPRLHTVRRLIAEFHLATEHLHVSDAIFMELNGTLGPRLVEENPLPPAA